ncbi:S24 family peptidase [Pontibacter burrus]|uniref:Helix-turn-helix transcriptional regulator n=1 Tax=Pontibacter burrus TaxID=2704466 RepID=A0A6B3LRU8_9BACT|nr:S24 family peptidase [Pontibacter burrus]NEM96200.1 helix-turn-helix transcriptional regulator [Pontibacter burrus]
MSVNQRLEDLVKTFSDGVVSKFAKQIGVSHTSIASMMPGSRESKPGFEIIAKITETFPSVNIEWLIKGKDPMLKTPGNKLQDYTKPTDRRVDEQAIPLYDFEAAAGLTKLFSNAENILDFIRVPNLPKCDGAVHISGDSMYPLLKSGDIVMYKQVQDIRNSILWGEMYLLSAEIGGDLLTLVKYIQRSDEGNDYVKLVSQNQYHSPIDIPLKNIRALAYIKASIRINSMA